MSRGWDCVRLVERKYFGTGGHRKASQDKIGHGRSSQVQWKRPLLFLSKVKACFMCMLERRWKIVWSMYLIHLHMYAVTFFFSI